MGKLFEKTAEKFKSYVMPTYSPQIMFVRGKDTRLWDDEGNEYKRGFKTLTIPAHTGSSCRNVTIRCVKFVLPESLDVANTPNSMCNTRNFVTRCFANYIDYDFECCTENDT